MIGTYWSRCLLPYLWLNTFLLFWYILGFFFLLWAFCKSCEAAHKVLYRQINNMYSVPCCPCFLPPFCIFMHVENDEKAFVHVYSTCFTASLSTVVHLEQKRCKWVPPVQSVLMICLYSSFGVSTIHCSASVQIIINTGTLDRSIKYF